MNTLMVLTVGTNMRLSVVRLVIAKQSCFIFLARSQTPTVTTCREHVLVYFPALDVGGQGSLSAPDFQTPSPFTYISPVGFKEHAMISSVTLNVHLCKYSSHSQPHDILTYENNSVLSMSTLSNDII